MGGLSCCRSSCVDCPQVITRYLVNAIFRRVPVLRKTYLRYTNDMRWACCSVCRAPVDYGRYIPGFIRYNCPHKPKIPYAFLRRFFL